MESIIRAKLEGIVPEDLDAIERNTWIDLGLALAQYNAARAGSDILEPRYSPRLFQIRALHENLVLCA